MVCEIGMNPQLSSLVDHMLAPTEALRVRMQCGKSAELGQIVPHALALQTLEHSLHSLREPLRPGLFVPAVEMVSPGPFPPW